MTPRTYLPVTALAVALSGWAGPAAALLEPAASGVSVVPKRDERDSRVRTVVYEPGAVIRLVGRRGQTLMVKLPPGQEIATFLASDQDVMDNVVPEDEPKPGQQGYDQNRSTGGRPQDGDRSCSVTANLQTCIRLERFFSFKPITNLAPQPVHIIALRRRANGQVEEIPYLFELEAPEPDENDGASYYSVEVVMPPPTAAPQSQAARKPAGRRPPSLAATQPQPTAVPLPAVVNDRYAVQGDRGLVGAAGR